MGETRRAFTLGGDCCQCICHKGIVCGKKARVGVCGRGRRRSGSRSAHQFPCRRAVAVVDHGSHCSGSGDKQTSDIWCNQTNGATRHMMQPDKMVQLLGLVRHFGAGYRTNRTESRYWALIRLHRRSCYGDRMSRFVRVSKSCTIEVTDTGRTDEDRQRVGDG